MKTGRLTPASGTILMIGDFEFFSQADIEQLHYTLQQKGQLPIWTICRPTTTDYAGSWSCRLHISCPGELKVTSVVIVRDTLEAVRSSLPAGLACLARHPSDDPVIEETWL